MNNGTGTPFFVSKKFKKYQIMEKKLTAPSISEQIIEIRLPESTTEFQKLIPKIITEICELKNRVMLQAYLFTDKQLKPSTDRFNDEISEFEINLLDAMENIMSAYIILEEIHADRTSKFVTGKEVEDEH